MTTEKHYRSLVKAVSWRLTGSMDTLIITFLVTGKLKWAFTISGVELFTKIFLYYVHERIWHKIRWGRTVERPNYEFEFEVGWPTGFEPATTSSTSLDSTIELRPPTGSQASFFRRVRQVCDGTGLLSFGCTSGTAAPRA